MRKNSLYGSIFYIIGLAYDRDIDYLADLYKVPPFLLENWLRFNQFPEKEIEALRNRKPFPIGYCVTCGINCDRDFCSIECKERCVESKRKLTTIEDTGKIPLPNVRNCYYDIETGEIIKKC